MIEIVSLHVTLKSWNAIIELTSVNKKFAKDFEKRQFRKLVSFDSFWSEPFEMFRILIIQSKASSHKVSEFRNAQWPEKSEFAITWKLSNETPISNSLRNSIGERNRSNYLRFIGSHWDVCETPMEIAVGRSFWAVWWDFESRDSSALWKKHLWRCELMSSFITLETSQTENLSESKGKPMAGNE